MNLSFSIAKRYLFSKKSHNAINLISIISVCGIAIATTAMVCALSVFNGFTGMAAGMFSTFDPQLKITSVKGKVFDSEDERILAVRNLPDIDIFSYCIEDNILLKYNDRQVPALLKGVPGNFNKLTQIDTILIDGEFKLKDDVNSYGILGIGLAIDLGVNAGFIYPLEIYAPKRNAKVNMANPAAAFNQEYAYIAGVFRMNQPMYDNQCIIVPIELTQTIFDYTTEVSSVEIKLKETADISKAQGTIRKTIGEEFKVQNQYEQQESSFRMMNMEKWFTYMILCFIMTIAIFNVVGSLSMLIIEKKGDIITLKNLGADQKLISRIFLFEGWMISFAGGVIGIVLGLILCLAQQLFGLLKLGTQAGVFLVDAYPVNVVAGDVIFIFATVLVIGFLTAIIPVRMLNKQ